MDYLKNVGLYLLILLALFVLIGLIVGLKKGFFKNLFNLVLKIVAFVIVAFTVGYVASALYGLSFVKDLIAQIITALEDAGISASVADGFAMFVLVLVLLPIMFIVVYLVVKAIFSIIVKCIPPLKRLVSKKELASGKSGYTAVSRLTGMLVGIVAAVMVYFVVLSPVFVLADVAVEGTVSIPSEVSEYYEEHDSAYVSGEEASSGVSSYAVAFEEGGSGEENNGTENTIKDIFGYLVKAKEYVGPYTDSFIYKMYSGVGISGLLEETINKGSEIEMELDGEKGFTKSCSDIKSLAKVASTIGAYYYCMDAADTTLKENITDELLADAMYGVVDSRLITSVIDPLMESMLKSVCESVGFTTDNCTLIAESISFADAYKLSAEKKKAESKELAKLIVEMLDIMDEISGENVDVKDQLEPIGKLLDIMDQTTAFGGTAEPFVEALSDLDEVKDYVSAELLTKLTDSVKGSAEVNYVDYMKSFKSAISIAEKMNDEETALADKDFTDDFTGLFDASSEELAEVVTEALKGVADKIEVDESTSELKDTLINTYFEELYNTAEATKAAAKADETKTEEEIAAEVKAVAEKEAEAFKAVVEVVDTLQSDTAVINDAVAGSLLNAVLDSDSIFKMAETINTPVVNEETGIEENSAAKEQLLAQVGTDTAAIESVIDAKADELKAANETGELTEEEQAKLDLIKSLLGIA